MAATEHALIGILIHRLGGEVTVTEAELATALDDFEMESGQDPTQFAWWFRVRPRQRAIPGDGATTRELGPISGVNL